MQKLRIGCTEKIQTRDGECAQMFGIVAALFEGFAL